jgi:hypothetical protein
MKLTPLPIKFKNSNITSSITISSKEENSRFNAVEIPTKNLASTSTKNTVSKESTRSSNYILPLILVGGGIWYFTKS